MYIYHKKLRQQIIIILIDLAYSQLRQLVKYVDTIMKERRDKSY